VALFPSFVSGAIPFLFGILNLDDFFGSPARLPAIHVRNLPLHRGVPGLGVLLCPSYLTPAIPPIPTFIVFPDTTNHISPPVKNPLPACGRIGCTEAS